MSYNISEIKQSVKEFVDDNWGSQRAKFDVEHYGSKLTVSVVVVDKQGKADKALLTPSMKNEMQHASHDLINVIERKFGIEMNQVSLSGNLIGLEKWDTKKSSVNQELIFLAKELRANSVTQDWLKYKRQNRISNDDDVAESAFFAGYDAGFHSAEKEFKK